MTKTSKPAAVTEAAAVIAKAAGKTAPAPAANAELKPRITMNLATGKVRVARPKQLPVATHDDPSNPDHGVAGSLVIPIVVPEGKSGAAAAEAIKAAVEAKAAAKSKADRASLGVGSVADKLNARADVKAAVKKAATTTAAGATVKVVKAAKSAAPAVKGDAVTQLTAASNKPAATGARPRGLLSAPPADMPLRINEEAAARINKGFTAEMLAAARRLVKSKKGNGTFTREQLLAVYKDAGYSRGKLMDAFYAGTERGVYVPA